MRLIKYFFIISSVLSIASHSIAQNEDETRIKELKQKLIDQFYRESDTIGTLRSENAFLPYEGKIIRKIIIQHYGFERTMYDSSKAKIVNGVVKLGNNIHTTTKDQIIKHNIFLKEGRKINPYKVADNERYLRDLDFIVDTRIILKPVKSDRDFVDVVVITRDVFALGGEVSPNSTTSTEFGIYHVNVGGRGQRIGFNATIDSDRDPKFGQQYLYRKNSIGGSFINGLISYTQLDNGSSYGYENENAILVRFDRPLISPYTRFAGGFEFSRNWSVNVYNKLSAEFRNYHYYITDAWVGYNIGIDNQISNRSRHFVALRTFNQRFTERPTQPEEQESLIYNNLSYVLGSVTFFNQNFYKTRYIYGFGRTEDVPYGRQITLQAGFEKRLGLQRPYIGAEFNKTSVRPNGDFYSFLIRTGSFRHDDDFEDVTILTSLNHFSKPISFKRLIMRQSTSISYTTILNQGISLPLEINNDFGVKGFRADSLLGTKRINVKSETTLFTPFKLIGFHFAFFTAIDMAVAAPKGKDLFSSPAYFGLGGGIRTRNENLVFGTIELRGFYFPKLVEDVSKFKITLSTNLRVKYTSNFVRAPSFIRYN